MRRIVLIIQNPTEAKFITDLLQLTQVMVIDQAQTMAEARERLWDTINGCDHLFVDGSEEPSPLWGFELKQSFEGRFAPIRVFQRKQPGAGRVGVGGRGTLIG
jgi:hypothetical protein